MKLGGNAKFGVLVGVLLSACAIGFASVGANENPYRPIVERNVFNLHPPPPPINPADLIKKAPPPKITFTGITTILGVKKAFLTVPPSKPGPPESIILAEGQAQNDIEVKRIDEKAQIVQVINHGEPQTLDFEHDAPKIAGPPPGVQSIPIAMPAPIPAAPPPGVQPMPGAGTVIRPLRSLPARNPSADGGLGAGAANVNQQSQVSNLSAEEQVALIELQRVKAIQQHDPVFKILPPTELTPEVLGQQAPQ
jgi:hypothetical protein